jgi:hypothetical protein
MNLYTTRLKRNIAHTTVRNFVAKVIERQTIKRFIYGIELVWPFETSSSFIVAVVLLLLPFVIE